MKRFSIAFLVFLMSIGLAYSATLTIQVEPGNIGITTVTPSMGVHVYDAGQTVNLAALPYIQCPSVYQFDHWTGGVVNPDLANTTVLMDADKVVTAVFVLADPVCGDQCHPNFTTGDLNHDCIVDLGDFAVLASRWMNCTKPECDELPPPPDFEPPVPNPTTLTVYKLVIAGQSYHILTAGVATDPSGVEYQFECLTNPGLIAIAVHVNWINTDNMVAGIYPFGNTLYPNGALKVANKIWIPVFGAANQSYRVRVRDQSPAQNTSQWSNAVNSEGQIDVTPPSPNPAQWTIEPYQNGPDSIRMIAVTAIDPEGNGVQYSFVCSENPALNSGWINNAEYVVTGRTAGQTYTFRVKYRDNSINQNETAFSSAASVTIGYLDIDPPSPAPTITSAVKLTVSGQAYHVVTSSVPTDPSGVEYQFECTTNGTLIATAVYVDWINTSNMVAGIYPFGNTLSPIGTLKIANKIWIPVFGTVNHTYRVRVRDQSPACNTTAWSLPVTTQ